MHYRGPIESVSLISLVFTGPTGTIKCCEGKLVGLVIDFHRSEEILVGHHVGGAQETRELWKALRDVCGAPPPGAIALTQADKLCLRSRADDVGRPLPRYEVLELLCPMRILLVLKHVHVQQVENEKVRGT